MAEVTYNLQNDVRARKVAKDLARLAKQQGMSVKLPAVQNAVAKMMGHADWKVMLASIGTTPSTGPEDHELDEIALAVRRAEQINAIKGLGFDSEQAKDLLTKLRPTGRTGASIAKAGRLAVIQTGLDYHPMRMAALWEELFHSLPGFSGSGEDLEERLAVWAEQRSMLSMDRSFCMLENGEVSGKIDTIFEVLDTTSIVMDASTLATTLANQELSPAVYANIPKAYHPGVYVHFGANAFPSPYRDAGVEGAYVNYHHYKDGVAGIPDSVNVMLVCSNPFQLDNGWDDGSHMMKDDLQELRNLLRGAWVEFSPGENETLADGIQVFEDEQEEEFEPGEGWVDYIKAPAIAALQAVKLVVDRKVVPVDAVTVDTGEALVRRLERATIEDQFLKAAANDERTPVVRYLGRTAPGDTVTTEYTQSYFDDSRPLDPNDILGIGDDLSGYWENCAAKIADRLYDRAVAHLSDTPYSIAHARAMVIKNSMRAIAFDHGAGCEEEPDIIALKEKINMHVDGLLAEPSPGISEFMPIAWLAAMIFNTPEAAGKAWERCKQFRSADFHNGMEILRDHLRFHADDIQAGKYGSVIAYFTGDVYEGTELAAARQFWDRWWLPAMTLPMTDDLLAKLTSSNGPGF
jgi:hypothetical protein